MKTLCFLNRVFTDKDDCISFFEIVKADNSFADVRTSYVSLDTLKKLSTDPKLTTDFSFEDGYLKCDSTVNRVCSNDLIKGQVSKQFSIYDSSNSLFDLLMLGVNNGFYLVDDRVAKNSTWTGNGFTSFHNIKFSKSSMSIYARVIFKDTCFNKHIVKLQRGILKFYPFKFLVPKDFCGDLSDCKKLGEIVINNISYFLYEVATMSLFCPINNITPPLINYANGRVLRFSEVLKVLRQYRNQLLHAIGNNTPAPKWVEDNDEVKEPFYGITFEYNGKGVSSTKELLDHVVHLCDLGKTPDEVKQELIRTKYNPTECLAGYVVASISTNSSSAIEAISNIGEMTASISKELFFADLFLYKFRSYSYLSKRNIAPLTQPYFTGGCLGGITNIRRILFNGVIK